MEECRGDLISEIQRERIFQEVVPIGFRDFDDLVQNAVESDSVAESFTRCHGRLGHLGDSEWRTESDHRVHRECDYVGAVFSSSEWTFGEKIGNSWKKILWYSGKISFIFSINIEMLQLLMGLGTFQLSDIFYNTVGGVLGGLMYCAVMKVRKHL